MVMIPTIQGNVEPQGLLRGQATANDFGGQMAEGLGKLANGVGQVGDVIQQSQERQDNTDNYTRLAKAKVDWVQNIQDRAASATPGDQTLVPGVVKDMGDYFSTNPAVTTKGNAQWTQMGAQLQSEMALHAIGVQGQLNGQAAINDNNERTKNLAVLASKNPQSVEDQIALNNQAIDDPNGIYFHPGMDAPTRDKLKAQGTEAIAWAASTSWVKDHPLEALATLSPTIKEKYGLYANLLKNGAAPGATVTLSKETMAQAPAVVPMAAQAGVAPGLALGAIEQGATQDPKGMVQSLAALQTQFNGNTQAALAAYHDGSTAVGQAMATYGSEWMLHLSPQAQAFSQGAMEKGGLLPPSGPAVEQPLVPAPPPVPDTPLQGNIPGLKYLPVDKQNAIGGMALEFANLQLNMDSRIKAEQKAQEAEAVSALRTQYETASMNAKSTKDFLSNRASIVGDQGLNSDPAARAWLFNFNNTLQDQKVAAAQGAANKGNPQEALRLMKEVQAPDTDPTKVYSDDHARARFLAGAINYEQLATIQGAISRAKDGGMGTLQQTMNKALGSIQDGYRSNLLLSATPGGVASASWNAYTGLEKQIATAKSEGWNPQELFTPGSKHYFMTPENLSSFTTGAKQGLADAAEKIRTAHGGGQPVQLGAVVGGFRFKGGDPGNKTNWEKVASAPAEAEPLTQFP